MQKHAIILRKGAICGGDAGVQASLGHLMINGPGAITVRGSGQIYAESALLKPVTVTTELEIVQAGKSFLQIISSQM